MSFRASPIEHRSHDDREVEVPLWMPGGAGGDNVPRELRQRLRSLLTEKTGSPYWPIVTAGMCIGLWFTMPDVPTWIVVVLPFFILIGWLSHRGKIQAMVPEIHATLLAAGRCVSCGYDLRGLPAVVDDGRELTICPECRAAWALPGGAGEAPDLGIGDQPKWRETRFTRLLADCGLGVLLPRKPYTAIDARGRMIEIVYQWVRQRPPSCWAEIPEDERRWLERRLYGAGRIWRWLSILGCAWMIGLLLLINGTTPSWPIALIALYVFWGVAIAVRPRFVHRSKVIEMVLKSGRCASCAASLPPPSASGFVDCTHCGAAWKPEDVGRPAEKAYTSSRSAEADPDRRIVYSPPRD